MAAVCPVPVMHVLIRGAGHIPGGDFKTPLFQNTLEVDHVIERQLQGIRSADANLRRSLTYRGHAEAASGVDEASLVFSAQQVIRRELHIESLCLTYILVIPSKHQQLGFERFQRL